MDNTADYRKTKHRFIPSVFSGRGLDIGIAYADSPEKHDKSVNPVLSSPIANAHKNSRGQRQLSPELGVHFGKGGQNEGDQYPYHNNSNKPHDKGIGQGTFYLLLGGDPLPYMLSHLCEHYFQVTALLTGSYCPVVHRRESPGVLAQSHGQRATGANVRGYFSDYSPQGLIVYLLL